MGCVESVHQFGIVVLLQVHQFSGRNFCLADGRHVHDNGYFPSGGHLFFHFSVVELYDRCVPSPDNASDQFVGLCFYVSFFPQLVAGPIVRARDFIPQIRRPLFVSNEMFGRGIFLIVSGLFKKAVISDYISVNFVERILIILLFIRGWRI